MTGRPTLDSDAGSVELISDVAAVPFAATWYEISHGSHFWFEWRLAATLALLAHHGPPIGAGLRALEVGCGTGILRSQLERETRWTVDGTDLDLKALAKTPRGRGRNLFYDIQEERPAFVARYDVVLLFDILEHIADPGSFLTAALAHLKPGGHLLVDVPAISALFSRYDAAVGHRRRYDRRSLAGELAPFACEIEAVRYWGFSMLPLLALRKALVALAPSQPEVIRRGFRPPGPRVEAFLRRLMRVETRILKHPPLGTSLLLLARKGFAGADLR